MRRVNIFNGLRKYLNELQIGRLELVHSLAPDCVIILTIADIMREYESTEEDEREVCRLLEELCKRHFNQKRTSNTPI